MDNHQAASTTIQVCPKWTLLVHFSVYHTHLTYEHPRKLH